MGWSLAWTAPCSRRVSALLTKFSENIARLVMERQTPSPAVPAPEAADGPIAAPPPLSSPLPLATPASELNALSLLWQIVKGWMRGLFQKKD